MVRFGNINTPLGRRLSDQPILEKFEHSMAERDMALLHPGRFRIGDQKNMVACLGSGRAVSSQKADRDNPHLPGRRQRAHDVRGAR